MILIFEHLSDPPRTGGTRHGWGMSLTVGSLFAGIGGFDLAAERVGFTVKWQVEIDDYCNRVLEKHWPHVRRYRDVRAIDWREVEPVDLLCGGFPCQDISLQGAVWGERAGLGGERSGLWWHMDRAVDVLRPRIIVVENVAALLDNGMGDVLGSLASRGYDAEWDCLPASAFGAPHQRDRVFVVAHNRCQRREGRWSKPLQGEPRVSGFKNVRRLEDLRGRSDLPKPLVRGSSDGLSARVDRLRGLGNAIVPQVAEWIFARIKEAEGLT